MVRVDHQLILLGGLEHAIANDDGTVTLHFSSQRTVVLLMHQVETLSNALQEGILQAQKMQAQQQAAAKFAIKPH